MKKSILVCKSHHWPKKALIPRTVINISSLYAPGTRYCVCITSVHHYTTLWCRQIPVLTLQSRAVKYREIKKPKFTQLESSTVGIQLWLFDPVFYQTCSFCLVRFGLYMTLRKTFWSHHSTYPRLYITTLQTLQNQCETLHQVLIWNHTLKTKLHRNHFHISTHQKCHFNDIHMKQGKTLHFWKGEFKIGREKKNQKDIAQTDK